MESNLPSESALAAKALLQQSQEAAGSARDNISKYKNDVADAKAKAAQLAGVVSRCILMITRAPIDYIFTDEHAAIFPIVWCQ